MSDKPPLTKDSPQVTEWFARWLEMHREPYVIRTFPPMATVTSRDFLIDGEKESNWGQEAKNE